MPGYWRAAPAASHQNENYLMINKVHFLRIVAVAMIVVQTGCQSSTRSGHSREHEVPAAGRAAVPAKQQKPDTSRPVAEYAENLDDQVTNNDFVVRLYPTLEATVFNADIRYGGNEVHQDITMLPSSYYKRIELKKGPLEGTCILGFVDPDGKFNEMKQIAASGTSIEVKTLKEYYLSNQ